MRLSSSTENDNFLRAVADAYKNKNMPFLIKNLDNPVSVVYKNGEQLTLPVITFIPDIFDKILQQTELNLFKISYLSSICILQLTLDYSIELAQSESEKIRCIQEEAECMTKQTEIQLMHKDLIFNQIFKDLCQQDEVGATLKICVITEHFLQNDTFKTIEKHHLKVMFKVLMMILQDNNMAIILGPRALQFLTLLMEKNKTAKKYYQKNQIIPNYLRVYYNLESDEVKRVKTFLIAKKILPAEEFTKVVQEVDIERQIHQFNDFDSLTYFVSRIPFKEIENIKVTEDESISFKVFDNDTHEMSQINHRQNREMWFEKLKRLNKTTVYKTQMDKKARISRSVILQKGSASFMEDPNMISYYEQSSIKDDNSLKVEQDKINNIFNLQYEASFNVSPSNSKGPKDAQKQQLIKEKKAEKFHRNQNNNGQCCTNNKKCIIM